MIIRPATQTDIPGIIVLLKQSLGESMIPKSESLWNWKHNENPFGPSYVLVAEEDNTLMGVRAFMRWQWQRGNKIYDAIRAVDTATHPEHQGKGIFKKLTLAQLELCKKEGTHFVFNTPNTQSRPGYLKMGWQQQGKMPMKLQIRRPVTILFNRLLNRKKYVGITEDPTPASDWSGVSAMLEGYAMNTSLLHSIYSPAYINWRYASNPLFNYTYFTDHKSYLLIGRVKYQSFIKELRLTDIFTFKNGDMPKTKKHIRQSLNTFCNQYAIDFVSMSGNQYLQYQSLLPLGPLPVKPLGPIVTIRDINVTGETDMLLTNSNWQYSLGDMELF